VTEVVPAQPESAGFASDLLIAVFMLASWEPLVGQRRRIATLRDHPPRRGRDLRWVFRPRPAAGTVVTGSHDARGPLTAAVARDARQAPWGRRVH